jgi:hypothetical protein
MSLVAKKQESVLLEQFIQMQISIFSMIH